MVPKAESFVTVSGRRIRVLNWGSGPPLLLIHGVGASAEWWRPNVPFFAPYFTVYAPDLPGSGQSAALTAADLDRPDQFIAALLDTLQLPTVSLIGHSMGGYVTASFAFHRPERIDSLILIDSAGFGSVNQPIFRLMTVPVLGEAIVRFGDVGHNRFVRSLFFDPAKAPADLIAISREYARQPRCQDALLRVLRAGATITGRWKRPFVAALLSKLTRPPLIVWGAQDPVFPAADITAAQSLMASPNVHILPHSGHLPQIEQLEAFNALAVPFLVDQINPKRTTA